MPGSQHEGLTAKEAQRRLLEDGSNTISAGKRKNALLLFFSQFKDALVMILLVSTVISVVMGELSEAFTIIAIIFLNALLGFFQEYRTEKTLETMQKMASPTANVIRDGRTMSIPSSEVVKGDILLVKAGDRVPADARILEAKQLATDESLITGESVPVEKAVSQSDLFEPESNRSDMVYMGTTVSKGRGTCEVCSIGMATEMGKIAGMLGSIQEEPTPLQKKLDQLGKYMGILCVCICAVVSLTGILRGEPVFDMLLTGLSLSVAAIPEGLPAIVTITLALAMGRILKKNALIRKLHAVETLGCANIICSDKTGTLTENKMTVKEICCLDTSFSVSGNGYEKAGKITLDGRNITPANYEPLKLLMQTAVLCSNAELYEEKSAAMLKALRTTREQYVAEGEPTETALLVMAAKGGITKPVLNREYLRIDEIPFDSDRKMMSVVVVDHLDNRRLLSKGAPDMLLDKCSYYLSDHGVHPLNGQIRERITAANVNMAKKAMRVLGFAYRDLRGGDSVAERDLIFIGMAGILDPPREEAFGAVRKCRYAGIRPVMITGDHKITAIAIAKQLGILQDGDKVYTGSELDALSDEELARIVPTVSVYARVNPGHKLRIVKALKKRGNVVAMTGDGVNDAPAIKESDIGVSMGINGTDVTKEASSIILLDDNFATLVSAVEEGRVIYKNIRKSIRYLLSCNIGEVLTMFVGMLMGMPVVLLPIQILLVNLATDGLPAIALGLEPPEKDIMNQKPRNTKDSVFSDGLLTTILFRGCLIGITTLAVFTTFFRQTSSLDIARTGTLLTLIVTQLFYLFECKEEHKSIFRINLFTNPALVLAALSSAVIMALVIYVPSLQALFKTVPLTGHQVLTVLLYSCGAPILSAIFSGGHSLRALRTKRRGFHKGQTEAAA